MTSNNKLNKKYFELNTYSRKAGAVGGICSSQKTCCRYSCHWIRSAPKVSGPTLLLMDVCPVSPVLSRKVLPPQHCYRPWTQSHKGLCPWLRCVFSFFWPALKPQSCFIDLRVISSSPAFHGCQAEHEAWCEEVWGFLSCFNDQSCTSGNNAQTLTFRKQVR